MDAKRQGPALIAGARRGRATRGAGVVPLAAYALLLVMPVVFIAALVGSAASLVGGA